MHQPVCRTYREALWLRGLLRNVAEELESMAMHGADVPKLRARAQLLRRRLHQGVPDEWSSER